MIKTSFVTTKNKKRNEIHDASEIMPRVWFVFARDKQQQTAIHCNTLQNAATQCNTCVMILETQNSANSCNDPWDLSAENKMKILETLRRRSAVSCSVLQCNAECREKNEFAFT